MSASDSTAPALIDRPEQVGQLASTLKHQRLIALDTEADSLYHYWEKTCLIQIGIASGQTFLIDPLAPRMNLAPLGPILADPSITTVVHAAGLEVRGLFKDFNFRIGGLFDTMLASQFLGHPQTGLAANLEREFDIKISKKAQRANWSARPLDKAMLAYASNDVAMLIPLYYRLRKHLKEIGRLSWVEEESQALALAPVSFEPPVIPKINGTADLSPRQMAVLDALVAHRELVASSKDTPRFKVIGDAVILRLAQEMPMNYEALKAIPGIPRPILYHSREWLEIIRKPPKLASKEPEVPFSPPPPPNPAVATRINRLRLWRSETAEKLGLKTGLLLPQRLLNPIAVMGPSTIEELANIEGIMNWRVQNFGVSILQALEITDLSLINNANQ